MTSPRPATRPETGTPLVELQGIRKDYQRGNETVHVLQALDLDIPRGDFLALMGPSGSGKTTLLNLLGGIDRPSDGRLTVDGTDIAQYSESDLPLLLTGLTAGERKRRVQAALSLANIADRAKHKPSELSGGQEQRVGIARAIVGDPLLLLCDEPTGDLDRKSGDEILDLLQALNREQGKTIVMVTHDPHAAARARRILYMNKGKLSAEPEK
jgi:putative ABC transport system ATP-binding protein